MACIRESSLRTKGGQKAKKEIYYYKTASDYEVDFLVKDREKMEIFQVCIEWNEKAEVRKIRSLVQAAKEMKLQKGVIVTAEEEKQWIIEGIQIDAIPLYKFIAVLDKKD